ncbi:MAG: hypothetical protein JSR81_12555, partial [Proteobacteria bacterium]|nr:hypothetical protein [Pseudomonadota bacterium]
LVRFPQFFISICFGLLLIAAHKWNLRQHMRAWVIACVLCLLIGTGVFLKYTDMRESNTAVLDEKRYVIGELRTDQEGVELQQACAITNGGRPCDNQTLLDFCHGRVSEIWTQASINSVQRTAVLLYITSALFFMGAMVSMLHALRWTESDPDDAESDEEPDDEDDGAKEKKDDAADDDDDGDEDDKKSDLLTGLRRRLLK